MSIERIGSEGGVIVLKLAERRFPGILIQGDTLLSLLQDLEEEAPGAVATETVRGWLRGYESVLDGRGMQTPYPRGNDHER